MAKPVLTNRKTKTASHGKPVASATQPVNTGRTWRRIVRNLAAFAS